MMLFPRRPGSVVVSDVPVRLTECRTCCRSGYPGDKARLSEHKLTKYQQAGVSAGMDVVLAFISEKYGRHVAIKLALMSEIDWKELGNGEQHPMYTTIN